MKRSMVVLLFLVSLSWALAADDHGDTPLTATPVSGRETFISACIEQPGDLDYFLFSAVEGRTYRLLTSHLSEDMDTVMFLFDADGQTILLVDDDSNGETASRLQWTCPASGTYFVMIRHALALAGTGCYEFSLSTLLVDDHGNDPLGATPLTADLATSGFIEISGDVDVFLFSVRRGYEYAVRFVQAVPGADLTLRLLAEDGATELGAADDAPIDQVVWTATADGTLFAAVSGEGEATASYEVTVSEEGYVDDYGNTPADAHVLATEAATIEGTIDVSGDQDWFTFDARQGTEYKIGLAGERTFQITLVAADGTTVLRQATSRDATEIDWTAPADETYYLSVKGEGGIGTYALSVSSTLQLQLLATFNPQGYSLDVAIRGETAYLVVGTKGLLLVDVTDPAQPREIGSHSTRGYAQAIAVSGDYAYVANRGEGLTILDVSDPTRPFEVGSIDTQGSAQDVIANGRTAYVADQRGGLQIVDVSRPEAPRLLATFETQGYAEAIDYRGGVVFVAAGDAGLELVNVSDPSAPYAISSLDLRGDASDLAVSDGIVYVAGGFRGIRIVDIGDLAAPVEIGYLSTSGEARGLTLGPGFLYTAERTEGLSVYSLGDPAAPELVARIDTPGEAVRVAVTDGYAFIADREKGMQIVQLFP